MSVPPTCVGSLGNVIDALPTTCSPLKLGIVFAANDRHDAVGPARVDDDARSSRALSGMP